MSYNRFQYWVKGPRHKKLGKAYTVQDKIKNGDFEYPSDVLKDMKNQEKDLVRRMDEYRKAALKKGQREDSIQEGIESTFKKARVSLLKIKEELFNEDERRLEEFKEAAFYELYPYMDRGIKQNLWDEILNQTLERSDMDNRINNTSDFYSEYKNRLIEYKEKINNIKEKTVQTTVQ